MNAIEKLGTTNRPDEICELPPGGAAPSGVKNAWRSFVKTLLASSLATCALVYLIVLIVDPYDSVPFSPSWERYPVTSHAREYNAVLARRRGFESAIIGNSTSMLLHPSDLSDQFGESFVMLAMPAASPYEQLKMLSLFNRHHTETKTLIIGLDPFWCAPDGSERLLGPMIGHGFPEWLYDSSTWNDLPPFNARTLQHTRSQLLALLGVRIRYPLRPDGYRDFTETYRTERDMDSVRRRIYEEKPWLLKRTRPDTAPSWPELDRLASQLREFPSATRKVAYFVPFHQFHQAKAGTDQGRLWKGCKEKAAEALGQVPNTLVLDFMIPSRITSRDENYIDGQHYRTEIASELAGLLYQGALGDTEGVTELRVLTSAQE